MELARERAQRVRDILGGIDTLRAGGEIYLPRLTGESDAGYAFRLKLAGFFNAPRRLVKAMAGLVFQRDPKLGKDGGGAPAGPRGDRTDPAAGAAPVAPVDREKTGLELEFESWDDRGNHGAVALRRLCERGMAEGFAGLLTDMPTRPSLGLSRPEAEALRLRPYQVPIRVDQIMRTRWAMWGSQRVLTYLELREVDEDDDAVEEGTFGARVVRYRVYSREVTRVGRRVVHVGPPTLQIWEQREGDAQPVALEGGPLDLLGPKAKALSAIPFSPFLAGDHDETEDDACDDEWLLRSPIQDLLDLALQWYQVYAERRGLTNRACTQTPWAKGYTPKLDEDGNPLPIKMGPDNFLVLTGENAGAGYLSPSADGFQPTKDDLEALERRMAAMGLAFLMSDSRAAETAEARRIDAAAQNATLVSIARALQDCAERAMAFHAEYLGVPTISVTINTDFERITADPTMIDALSKLAQVGQITIETLLALLERWRVLPDGFDVTAEVEKLPKPVAAPVAGAAPSTAGGLFDKVRADMALATTGQTPPPATNAPPAQAA